MKVLSDKNLSPVKRAAAIHDLSGFGRCALTVVIPVLSSMGIQTVPLPTALLSTHTGGWEGFSFMPLTEQMKEISDHWNSLGISFDAIYTGFLGSCEQARIVREFIERFGTKDNLVLIDPVMGDDGVAYQTIGADMVESMRGLVKCADITTPNLTEVYFLLDKKPDVAPVTRQTAAELLRGVASLGAKNTVITGVRLTDCPDMIVTSTLDCNGNIGHYPQKELKQSYPGTGDLFASVLLGKMIAGKTLADAAAFSSDFVYTVMEGTQICGTPPREGVLLEKYLGRLSDTVEAKNEKQ